MISSIHHLGFLMHPKGGRKGQKRAHSLLCSLEEKQEEQEDENNCIGRGQLGRMLPWREASSLESQLFSGELPILRRAHHQWVVLTPVILQWDQLQREATHQSFIPGEGFSILSSQFASRAVMVVLRAFMAGAPSQGAAGSFELVFQLGSSCYYIMFIYILYLMCSTIYFPHIQTYIPNWFSPVGFYPGSC